MKGPVRRFLNDVVLTYFLECPRALLCPSPCSISRALACVSLGTARVPREPLQPLIPFSPPPTHADLPLPRCACMIMPRAFGVRESCSCLIHVPKGLVHVVCVSSSPVLSLISATTLMLYFSKASRSARRSSADMPRTPDLPKQDV